MTMTGIEQIVLEDLEHDRPCTPWSIECGLPAEWLLVTTCCDAEMPLCNGHKVASEADLVMWSRMRGATLYCKACDTDISLDEIMWHRL